MQRNQIINVVVLLLLLLTSCTTSAAPQQTQQTPTLDYQKTKEMVLDVIRTADGKKAIQDLMSDQEFKQNIIVSSKEIEQAVAKSFTQEKTKKEWEKLLVSPSIAHGIAKANEEQHKQLVKTLLKDPEYQKLILDIMKNPQFSKQVMEIFKSQEYRQEAMKIMEEVIQIPSFQEKLNKVVKLPTQDKKKDSSGEAGEGGEEEGNESDGADGGGT